MSNGRRYTISTTRSAEKDIEDLPRKVQSRVSDAILALEENPRHRGSRKLKARPGYRVRVGDYRVVFDIDDESGQVVILAVGHRRDIYG